MILHSEHIYIRPLELSDAPALHKIRESNRAFFEPFEPIRLDAEFTVEAQEKQIEASILNRENDSAYNFGIFLSDLDEVIGQITLSKVIRGPLQNANLGYHLDQAQNGKGYTTQAVRLALGYAFEHIKLHRVEAGVMPRNIGSSRVLEKAGFRREGLALRYLNINGVWEDHLMYAITKEEWEL